VSSFNKPRLTATLLHQDTIIECPRQRGGPVYHRSFPGFRRGQNGEPVVEREGRPLPCGRPFWQDHRM